MLVEDYGNLIVFFSLKVIIIIMDSNHKLEVYIRLCKYFFIFFLLAGKYLRKINKNIFNM